MDDIGKDTFYRFVNLSHINWFRFTSALSANIICGVIDKATDEKRVKVFIVDETLYKRTYSRHAELVSWVHDHVRNIKVRGCRLLTLGWSDGNTFIHVNGVALSSEKHKQELENLRMDKRSCGYRHRQLASPSTILALEKERLDVIAMVKKTSKVHYLHDGKMISSTEIYKRNRKRRGRSKHLLSVEAWLCGHENKSIPVRLALVRKRGGYKKYLVLLSTNMDI
jgi:hypothetical protein